MFSSLIQSGRTLISTTTSSDFAIDWTGVDFSPIVEGVTGALPFIIIPVIGFIGLRKGIQFAKGMLKGA